MHSTDEPRLSSLCIGGCCIRGHHIYKAMWTPTVGEILAVGSRPGIDQRAIGTCDNKGSKPALTSLVNLACSSSSNTEGECWVAAG